MHPYRESVWNINNWLIFSYLDLCFPESFLEFLSLLRNQLCWGRLMMVGWLLAVHVFHEDQGIDWRQEEKGTTEDEVAGWHHRLNGHEFEQALGDGEGQGSLACCSPWGRKESDTAEWLNNSKKEFRIAEGQNWKKPILDIWLVSIWHPCFQSSLFLKDARGESFANIWWFCLRTISPTGLMGWFLI